MRFPWLPILLIMVVEYVSMQSMHRLRQRWAKQCDYDCSQCKVWDCEAHTCRKKRMEDDV